MECHCGLAVAEMVAQKDDKNKGRHFWCCPRFATDVESACRYFKWESSKAFLERRKGPSQQEGQAAKRKQDAPAVATHSTEKRQRCDATGNDDDIDWSIAQEVDDLVTRHRASSSSPPSGDGRVGDKTEGGDGTPHAAVPTPKGTAVGSGRVKYVVSKPSPRTEVTHRAVPSILPDEGTRSDWGEQPHLKVPCGCEGVWASSFVTAKPGRNQGRRFYCCGKPKDAHDKCKFWEWHDTIVKRNCDPLGPEAREVVIHNRIYSKARVRFRPAAPATDDAVLPVVGAPTGPHPRVVRTDVCAELFAGMARKREWSVSMASAYLESEHGVDMYIWRGRHEEEFAWARVVAARRLLPEHAQSQVDFSVICVPLHGPGKDDPGFLRSGMADVLAFETEDGFLLANRRLLWKYVDETVKYEGDDVAWADSLADALGKPVRMSVLEGDTNEVCTLLKVDDLKRASALQGERKILFDHWSYDMEDKEALAQGVGESGAG